MRSDVVVSFANGTHFILRDFSMSARRHKNDKSTAPGGVAAKAQQPAAPKRARPVLSRRRKWLFRLTAIVAAPVLCIAVLEAGLRLGGYGYPTAFLVGPDAGGTYTANPCFGWRFFPRGLARKPEPCFISAKAAGAVRIFVLGSSAAQGIPNPSFSFGRILEVMLHDRYPSAKFEVVNAAMTAINSHVALEIARDCAAYHPDLLVIYMGNNEVVGPYGPGTVFQQWSPSLNLIRANVWLKSTRTGQLLGNAAGALHSRNASPAGWQGMEMFLGNQVAADDPRLEAVYDNYRQNLIEICGIARRAGAGVILSTVAVNLRDCPPFASQHRSDLSPEELTEWTSIYQAGVDLESRSQRGEALKKYEAAARIDDRFAELQFRVGRCLAAEGRPAEARERFVLARDLDVLRFRADSRINAILREVAAAEEARGVRGVDAEQALANSDLARDGIAGEDLFHEHVHLTFDGNYLLARTVLEQVEAALPHLAASRKTEAVLSRKQCAESLVLTPWDEYQTVGPLAEVMTRPPFKNQLDNAVRVASSRERAAGLLRLATTPQALEAAFGRYEEALEKSPDDWDMHHRFARVAMASGHLGVAADQLRIVLKKTPWDAGIYIELGNVAQMGGKTNEAVDYFRKALELDSGIAAAHFKLALALSERGSIDEAIAHFQRTLEIDSGCVQAHSNLGVLLHGCGRIDEAVAHFQDALKLDPANAGIRNNLEKLLEARSCSAKRASP
jgi:tetratricopeptide (TPR) repeat protein